MPDDTEKRSEELYVVELDGVKRSEHRIFIEALKCGLELKRLHPRSKVNLRDAHDKRHPMPAARQPEHGALVGR
jgi:hypothetical protein